MSDYPISTDLLQSQHIGVLATTGAGKSYLTRGLAEVVHKQGWRHGIIDKLGNYWGLTISKDGKQPGLEYVIFGGRKAHVEMTCFDGEKIAALFLEHNIPAIFDLSMFKRHEQEQWVADFCDTVFLHNTGSLHLFMDEIQSWVPQSKSADCYSSVERLFTQGRGLGIKLIVAAQRPAAVSKDALYMLSSLVAMRMVGKIDRKWVSDLLEPYVDDVKTINNALPGLKTGTGYLYDPLAGAVDLVGFPQNQTFDSSATPRHGDKAPTATPMTSELVEQLRAALAPKSVPAKAEPAGEPESSKSMIAELAKAKQDLGLMAEKCRTFEASCRATVQVYAEALRAIRNIVDECATMPALPDVPSAGALPFAKSRMQEMEADGAKTSILPSLSDEFVKELSSETLVDGSWKKMGEIARPRQTAASADSEYKSQTRPPVWKMVLALRDRYPAMVHIDDVCRMAGVSQKSSAYRENLRDFQQHHLVSALTAHPDFYTLAEEGLLAFPDAGQRSGSLLESWLKILPASQKRILQHFVELPPGQILVREEIGSRAGISLTSSGLDTSIRALRDQGLLEKVHHGFRLTRKLV